MEYLKLEAFTREHISELFAPLHYSYFRAICTTALFTFQSAIFTQHHSHLESCFRTIHGSIYIQ